MADLRCARRRGKRNGDAAMGGLDAVAASPPAKLNVPLLS